MEVEQAEHFRVRFLIFHYYHLQLPSSSINAIIDLLYYQAMDDPFDPYGMLDKADMLHQSEQASHSVHPKLR